MIGDRGRRHGTGRTCSLRTAWLAAFVVLLLLAGPIGAIQHQSSSTTAGSNNATSITLPRPTTAANDVLVAVLALRGGATTLTAPAGWALLDRADHPDPGMELTQALYWRVATASEPADYTWSYDPGASAAGAILAYAGVDTADPFDGSASSSGSSNPLTAPSVTSSGADAALVTFFSAARAGSITEPAGMTPLFPAFSAGAGPNGVGLAAADEARASAGATGTRDATSNANGVGYLAHSLLLKPPTVSFRTASSSGDESVTPASLQVDLSAPSSLDTTIDYAATGGTASGSGGDFTMQGTGTLTIVAGATTGTIEIDVVDDAEQEADETVEITLSDPSNARLATSNVHMYTILDNDGPRIEVASDPVEADGSSLTGQRWGGWSAQAGAAPATSTNYLKITNIGPSATQQATIDFTDLTFAGVTQTGEAVGLDDNIEFAWWEDTSPSLTSPGEGTYSFGSAAPNGDVTITFSGTGNIIYVTYQLTAIDDPVVDQEYAAQYTVAEV